MRRVAVGLVALGLIAGCGDDSDSGPGSGESGAVPRSVQPGAVVAVGEGAISKGAFDRAAQSRVSGVSPLNGRAASVLVPLDPPKYKRCAVALKLQAMKAAKAAPKGQRAPVPDRAQLLAMCETQHKTTLDGALSTQIQQQWAIAQAAEEDMPIPDVAVDASVEQYKQSQPQWEPLLKKSGLTADDVRFQLRAQLAQQALIEKRLEAEGPGAANDPNVAARVQVELQNELLEKWRPRTLCGKDRLVSECSNGPKAQPLTVP